MLETCPDLSTNSIIQKHAMKTILKIPSTKIGPFVFSETNEEEIGGIQSLFNDKETSDITIRLGERLLYCHRTVLSSYSTYFEALFHNNCSFNDLGGGVYRVECTEFGEELHETVIKFCYGFFREYVIPDSMVIPLLKCASFYGVTQLVDYAVSAIEINAENYFEMVSKIGSYPCETLCIKFVDCWIVSVKPSEATREKLALLPEQIKERLLWRFVSGTSR